MNLPPGLEGEKGLVVGIANAHRMAWGCAPAFRTAGATLAVTWRNGLPSHRQRTCMAASPTARAQASCGPWMQGSFSHSFARMARLAERLMRDGGTLLTMSSLGAAEVINNYGLMGPVKAALESSARDCAASWTSTVWGRSAPCSSAMRDGRSPATPCMSMPVTTSSVKNVFISKPATLGPVGF